MAVEYVGLRFLHVYGFILIYVSFLQFPSSFGRSFEGETQYLERGRQGVAACPALLGAGLIPSEVPVIYWYLGPITRDALPFIVKNEGNILFGDGVPVGLYGINDELSLIISQVRNSSAGTYYCRLAPQRLAFQDASVPIEVIVSPDPDELPVVSPCDEKPIPSLCEISTDQSVIGLTCKVKNTFPAVELQILRLPAGDGNKVVQLKDAVIVTEQVTVPLLGNLTENERLRTDNTFTTTASAKVEVGVRGGVFICNSSGPVPGKGKSTLVVISKEVPVAPTTQTTSHATTFKTGVKTTNEETTMSSVETGDTEATCEMLGWTIILIVLTLLFAFLWLVSIVLSQRITVLKNKILHIVQKLWACIVAGRTTGDHCLKVLTWTVPLFKSKRHRGEVTV
ncbi:uncharacterized protein [Asterias amurensis]|uniref:uncharacterized protein isoform X1 n=1 Tax=Asterias amurensis TaxID=7602 RepID=UPI003AB137A4